MPWFVRLHAAATGVDPLAPVHVARTVSAPMRAEHRDVEDVEELLDDVREATRSDELTQQAYREWLVRAAGRSG